MLNAGADKVSLNTSAVLDPEIIGKASSHFGNQCIVVAIDARRIANTKSWEVYTHGGRRATGIDAVDWAQKVVQLGRRNSSYYMDCDGVQKGYDIDLNKTMTVRQVEVPVIASGGAGQLNHLVDVVKEGNASAVLAASIFHFGTPHTTRSQRSTAGSRITCFRL